MHEPCHPWLVPRLVATAREAEGVEVEVMAAAVLAER
tara:strand:- start:105 stop:215 length:111 start_codon:yes stop_codon:yes gene_type:complete